MKKLALIAGSTLMLGSLLACPSEEKPKEPEKPVEVKKPEVVLPPYNPTGDHADIKKEAAAGINKDNAEAKAKEVEAALDSAIKTLEEAAKKDG